MSKLTQRDRPRRLDVALVEEGLVPSRARGQALILAAKVLVNGEPARSPAQKVLQSHALTLKEPDIPYVSRGGVKLAGALDCFGVSPEGLVALDVGASTGGFTDCLLQRGARMVYAVDVGYGQIAWSLRQDQRVRVVERANARSLSKDLVQDEAQLVTADLSFISVAKVLPALLSVSAQRAPFVVLVKPQFELGPHRVGKGGVVRDDAARAEAVDMVAEAASKLGLRERGRSDSVLAGPKGNREIFLWLER